MCSSSPNKSIPAEFICPITNKVMNEPMMSKTGQTYEREAIMAHLDAGNETCPVTNQPLRIGNLISNKMLQWKIQEWRNSGQKSLSSVETLPPFQTQTLSSFACLDVLSALERESMSSVFEL